MLSTFRYEVLLYPRHGDNERLSYPRFGVMHHIIAEELKAISENIIKPVFIFRVLP